MNETTNRSPLDDEFHFIFRSLLIDLDDAPETEFDFDLDALRHMIRSMNRDQLTATMLEYSICPLHACDYAICFDDANPECAPIRTIHPSHDT